MGINNRAFQEALAGRETKRPGRANQPKEATSTRRNRLLPGLAIVGGTLLGLGGVWTEGTRAQSAPPQIEFSPPPVPEDAQPRPEDLRRQADEMRELANFLRDEGKPEVAEQLLEDAEQLLRRAEAVERGDAQREQPAEPAFPHDGLGLLIDHTQQAPAKGLDGIGWGICAAGPGLGWGQAGPAVQGDRLLRAAWHLRQAATELESAGRIEEADTLRGKAQRLERAADTDNSPASLRRELADLEQQVIELSRALETMRGEVHMLIGRLEPRHRSKYTRADRIGARQEAFEAARSSRRVSGKAGVSAAEPCAARTNARLLGARAGQGPAARSSRPRTTAQDRPWWPSP